MSLRPLALLAGLTFGDYLLWNWSLNGNHTVLALAAGLTLPPLALASLWLMALNAARLIAGRTRRARARPAAGTPGATRRPRGAQGAHARENERSSGRIAA